MMTLLDYLQKYEKNTPIVSNLGKTLIKLYRDVNARNILVDPNTKKVVLIDYANVDETGHIARDTSKLEADVVFSVLDRDSKNFYDWNRINEWGKLPSLLELKNVFNFDFKIISTDPKVMEISNFIIALRKELKENIYPSLEASEYLTSLLYYSFHYLTYPDISIQKKVFGAKWLSQIITQLKNASQVIRY